MRKALVVGIDHYDHIRSLSGAVNDASHVREVLERHADGAVNFTTPRLLTGRDSSTSISRRTLTRRRPTRPSARAMALEGLYRHCPPTEILASPPVIKVSHARLRLHFEAIA